MADDNSNNAALSGMTGAGDQGNGLIGWFAGNPVAANLLMVALVIGGALTGMSLIVRDTPVINYDQVEVSVNAPGSSAQEVQEDIVRRIEEAVIGIPSTERIVGTSTEGLALVTVEFSPLADDMEILQQVGRAVEGLENFPPSNADAPEFKLTTGTVTALTLAVTSEQLDIAGVQLAAEAVRDELVQLSGISEVTLRGARDREITVALDQDALRRHGLTYGMISNAIQSNSLNVTFGELRTPAGDIVLNTVSQLRFGPDFETVAVHTGIDGKLVRLGDVATITDGFSPDDLVTVTVDGAPAVLVTVGVAEWQSLTDIGDQVKEWLASYQPLEHATVAVWRDPSSLALERISGVFDNVILGVVFVFAILVTVFNLRAAIWITVGIPVAFIGSLLFLPLAAVTINVATITGFFIIIGLVVDDALIVGDSIDREIKDTPGQPLAAAIRGARRMVGPVTVGAVTTGLAFVPLLFAVGQLQFLGIFTYVVIFVLLISLVEAFFILPAHLAHENGLSLSPLKEIQGYVIERVDRLRDNTVAPAVAWAIEHVWATFAIAAAVFLAALVLLWTDAVRFTPFERASSNLPEVRADLRLPVGTPFETTRSVAAEVARFGRALNDDFEGETVDRVSVMAGYLFSSPPDIDEIHESHLASVLLHLASPGERDASVQEVEAAWVERIRTLSALEQFDVSAQVSASGAEVAYSLQHEDIDVLASATAELSEFMADIPGVYGVTDSLAPGKRHIDFQVTAQGLAAGLTPAGIATELSGGYLGQEAQEVSRGREEVRVVLRYPEASRSSFRELARERISLPSADGGGEMPLSRAMDMLEQREPASLTRIDAKQAARVSGNADFSVLTASQARAQIADDFLPGLQARHPGLRVEADGSALVMRMLFQTAAVTVPAVLLVMYGLMAALLRSYWKPMVAVFGFPLAFAGAVIGHWVFGWDFGAISFFGVVAVAGVVVNDALVLLDRYNQIRSGNDMVPAVAALAAATRSRFRPVFLTTITTAAGLSPLLYERSDLLVFLVPFVVSIIGGLVLASVFTLFVLPALAMAVEGRNE